MNISQEQINYKVLIRFYDYFYSLEDTFSIYIGSAKIKDLYIHEDVMSIKYDGWSYYPDSPKRNGFFRNNYDVITSVKNFITTPSHLKDEIIKDLEEYKESLENE